MAESSRLVQSGESDGNPTNNVRAPATEATRVELDDSGVVALYANMCRVASTPEEVILDLALNQNPLGTSTDKIRVSQRVILTHYTAKRLAALLTATTQRHEQMFGTLETDVRKRVKT
jgi:hypothetical protein